MFVTFQCNKRFNERWQKITGKLSACSNICNLQALKTKLPAEKSKTMKNWEYSSWRLALWQWFSNFREAWPSSKFNWRILNTPWHLDYAISRQSYLVKASARGPQGGGEGRVWETLPYDMLEAHCWLNELKLCFETVTYPDYLVVAIRACLRKVALVAIRTVPSSLFLNKTAFLQRPATVLWRTHELIRVPILSLRSQVGTPEKPLFVKISNRVT